MDEGLQKIYNNIKKVEKWQKEKNITERRFKALGSTMTQLISVKRMLEDYLNESF